jgi:hypothetical protein
MRVSYLPIAALCIVIAAGVGIIRAGGAGLTSTRAASLTASPARLVSYPGMLKGSGKPGLAGLRTPGARLAQAGIVTPAVPSAEATSGNPSQAPYKWIGLLVIPEPTQQNPNQIGLCTAEFITPSVLLTAGHCLRDLPDNPLGPWPDAAKGTFWLQYQNDSGTTFDIVCAKTNPGWVLPSNYKSLTQAQQNAALNTAFQHDYAMILVKGKSPTGVMQYALDWKGKATYAYRIGYPGNILNSAIVQKAPGYVFFSNEIPMGQYSPLNLVVQWGPITDATNGMSGGPWVVNLNATESTTNNILIAVTSFGALTPGGAQAFPGGTFASYLTAAEFNPLLTSVANGCK